MSLPTLTFRTVCTDPRCTTTGTCWRVANERYGDAPGENYGPRCVPVPAPSRPLTNDDLARAYDMGRDMERADTVAWLREEANAPHPIEAGERALSPSGRGLLLLAASRIERGEHRRSPSP